MSKKNVILGFFTGTVVGAAVALLYAPQKGKYLRAEIKKKAGQAADDVNAYIRNNASKVSNTLRGVMKKTA